MEIILSDQQQKEFQEQVYKAVTKAVEQARSDVGFKTWMKSKDLVNYLPIGNSAISDNLKDLPYHLVGGTKFYNKQEVDEYLLNL